jgi:putative ABC transport system ATP-binding protein
MSFLEAVNINYFYSDGDKKRLILKDVSYMFETGIFHVILGESGSGKTTFLSLLSALDRPKSGNILYMGQDIFDIGHEKYRRNSVGIVFQAYNLIPYMTAVENIKVAMSITDNKIPKNINEIAYNLLDYIGLDKAKANRNINKLSGGEQQRVAIARALATNVNLILADEPTGNLDDDMEREIIDILKKLAHDHRKCVIVVTHSTQIAREADKVLRLRKGKLEPNE